MDDGTYMYKLYMHNNITLRLYLKASDINNNEHSSHFDIIFKFYFICVHNHSVYINKHEQNNHLIKQILHIG